MRIAILVQCHKNIEQINMFLDAMKHPSFTFFVHLDKKVCFDSDIANRDDVIVLPDEMRINVQWAMMSQIDASLNLMYYAKAHGEYDYFWLCSGQCFPIKTPEEIIEYFIKYNCMQFIHLFDSYNNNLGRENNYDKRNAVFYPRCIQGNSLWRRISKRVFTELTGGYNKTWFWARRRPVDGMQFYFGSQWICLSDPCVDWIFSYLNTNPQFYEFYKNCHTPDESFFQTLVMNSPYASKCMDYLHYIDWSKGRNNPKILTVDDLDALLSSDKLMARKFDISVDRKVVDFFINRGKGVNIT